MTGAITGKNANQVPGTETLLPTTGVGSCPQPDWLVDHAVLARDLVPRVRKREPDTASVERAAALQRIGELSMENELLRAKMERPGPLARRRSR